MARALPRPTMPASVMPGGSRITASQGALREAQTFQQVATQAAETAAELVDDEMKRRAVREASRMIARGEWNAVERSGVYWDAFNRVGRTAQASLISANVRRTIDARLAEARAKLPTEAGPAVIAGYDAIMKADRDRLLEGISDPQLRAQARVEWDRRAPSARDVLAGAAGALERERNFASLEEDLLDSRRAALNAWRNAGREDFDPAAQQLAQTSEQEFLAHLKLQEAFGATPAETAKAALAYETARTREIVIGQFRASVDRGPVAAVRFIGEVYDGTRQTGLDPDENRKLVSTLMQELKRSNDGADYLLAREKQERTERHRAGNQAVIGMVLSGAPTAEVEATIRELVDSDMLGPADARAQLNFSRTRETTWDNDETVFAYTQGELRDAPDEELVAREDITWATKRRVIKQRREMAAGRLKWTRHPDAQEARRRIRGMVGVDGLVTGADMAERKQQAAALETKMFDAVDAFRLDNPQASDERLARYALEATGPLLQGLSAELATERLAKIRQRRERLNRDEGFEVTAPNVQAKLEAGDISERTANELLGRVARYDRQEAEARAAGGTTQ